MGMGITLNRKVRSRVSEPSPIVPEPEAPKRGRGRPPGTENTTREKLNHERFLGVDLTKYWRVSNTLKNQLVANVATWTATILADFQKFYSNGGQDLIGFLTGDLQPRFNQLGQELISQLLFQERGHLGQEINCCEPGCNGKLQYQGDVDKKIKTMVGEVVARRSYYRGCCGHSCCPLDVRLGLEKHSALSDVLDLITEFTTSLAYGESVDLLEKALPLKLSLKFVEDVTATQAAYIKSELDREVAEVKANPSKAACRRGSLIDGVILGTTDGGFVKVRDHTELTHEFKLVGFAEVVPIYGPSPAEPDKYTKMFQTQNKGFIGHLASAEVTFEYAQAEYFRRGLHRYKTVHLVADGAVWCLARLITLAQEDQEISVVLDWWHADERLGEFTRSAYPHDESKAKEKAKTLQTLLWNSDLDEFFKELNQISTEATLPAGDPSSKAVLDFKAELKGKIMFFENRRSCLRYKECRDRALPVGSGVIEGGVRFLGKDRLDRTGMRWNIQGAENILILRCAKYSGRLKELNQKRDLANVVKFEKSKLAWLQAA